MTEYLSNKFRWLSLIATWAVVGIHSRTTADAVGVVDFSTYIQDKLTDLFRFAVPLFFVISGFLFVDSYEKHGWLQLLKRKAKSLYLPMVLWGGIGLIMFLPIRIYIKEDIPTLSDFLKLPFLVLASGGGHFWYVRMLILFFAIAPVVYYVANRRWAVALCFVGALLIPAESAAAQFHIPVAIIFFLLGTQLATRCHCANNVLICRGGVACLLGLLLSFYFKKQRGIS